MHILTDASSVVIAYELIHGIQRPSALNLFELARLVESIIIHDKVTVLDTSPSGSGEAQQISLACESIPNNVVTVEKADAFELITRYVDRSHPFFSKHLAEGSEYMNRARNYRDYDATVGQLEHLLLRGETIDMQEYAKLLEDLCNLTESATLDTLENKHQKRWLKLTEKRSPRNSGSWFTGRISTPERGGELDAFEDQHSIFAAYCKIYRLCDPSGGSGFAQWRGMIGPKYEMFASNMFSRANLYLLAGELFGAPYRPGALRWPICWEHFRRGQLSESSVGEAFVRLAEKLELEQVQKIKELLQNGSVSVTVPIFLRVVMKECGAPDDILKKAVSIRQSAEATRFRLLSTRLTQKLEEERFDVLIKDLSDCARDLCRVFGLEDAGVNWQLLSAPSISMKRHYAFDQSVSLSATGKTLADICSSLWTWWRARRYGLITKAAKTVKDTKSLTKQVSKLFGHTLSEKDYKLLARIENLSRK